jgi:serine protease Do
MYRKPLMGAAVAALLSALFFAGEHRAQNERRNEAADRPRDAGGPYERRTALVEAVEKTRDAIVNIKVMRRNQIGNLREVVGSGVIVDARGYIITNHHVVMKCEKVVVVLRGGVELAATIHTEDADNDLAILKVKTDRKLKELKFAPASDLMVGETVIAVGNPHGYQHTVTVGIISALGRQIEMPTGPTLSDLIQHSASINPGNSGGPLLNINGELIGINVAMRNESQSLAFALTSDAVQRVLAKHLAANKVGAVGHGIAVREQVTAPEGAGRQQVVVDAVPEDSLGARAGLKPGDVVVRIGDREVGNRFDLERALWDQKGGEIVAVVARGGREVAVSLPLGGDRTAAAPKKN